MGNLDANDSNCFTLTVKVADFATQGSTITNTAKMYTGNTLLRTTNEPTKICCETTIIYVDKNASSGGDGKTWDTAYQELRDALANKTLCTDQIWVANGTYKPTDTYNSSATFQLFNGIDVYGHFGGIDSQETMLCQRNFADANNETILTGDIDDNNTADISNVVTAANSRLDGFTVKKSTNAGIYAANCSPTIANCVIKENTGYYGGIFCYTGTTANITNTLVTNNSQVGIYGYQADLINIDKCTISANIEYNLNVGYCDVNALDSVFSNVTGWNGIGIQSGYSNLTLNRCDISDNSSYSESGGHGIYCSKGATIIEKCHIQRNRNYGIYSLNATQSDVIFKNNIISDNGSAGISSGGGYGGYEGSCQIIDNLIYSNDSNAIYLYGDYYYDIKIRNNTITKNIGYGIYRNTGHEPAINSNIIYGNTIGGLYGTFSNVTYNCIQGGYTGTGNISSNPLFRNADANDFHLTSASTSCINTGNTSTSGDNETDIDGEQRKIGSVVDRGSDEYCPYDLSQDGYVDFYDFAAIAKAWRTHTGQTDFNDRCDFYDDGATDYINYRDLELFCDYWLSPVDWQGIGGQGAYFAEAECPLELGEMMMMSQSPSESAGSFVETHGVRLSVVSPPIYSAGSSDFAITSESVEEVFDVNETLDWLNDLWQTDESIRESFDANDWQEFLDAIKNTE